MTLIQILESRAEALTVQQVAELLGVSDKKIYRLAAAGVLPAFRVGKSVRFDAHDVADWLRKRKPSDEIGPKKPRKERVPSSDQRSQEAGPPDHLWRNKVKSLEAALAMDDFSE